MARTSLVDETENALRERLAPGRARPGRPAAAREGVGGGARGLARHPAARARAAGGQRRDPASAGQRHVRRPGGDKRGVQRGTRGARVVRLARAAPGPETQRRNLQIEQARVPGYVAEVLKIRRGTRAPLIQRTLLADGTVAAQMRDIVHPDVEVPPAHELRAAVAEGEMVLDVLVGRGVPIAFARTSVRPRLVEPQSRLGSALGVTRVAAALEMIEVMHLAAGKPSSTRSTSSCPARSTST